MKKERINEIWGVLFLLLGLFAFASLIFFDRGDVAFYTSHPATPVENYTGLIGSYLSFGLHLTFGLSAFLIPALFLLWSSCFFHQKVPEKKFFKFVGLAIALFSMSTLVTITVPEVHRFEQGGAVGFLAGNYLLRYFGYLGSYIVAGACLLLSLLLATDFLIYPIVKSFIKKTRKNSEEIIGVFEAAREWILSRLEPAGEEDAEEEERQLRRFRTRKGAKNIEETGKVTQKLPDMPIKVKKYRPDLPAPVEEKTVAKKKSVPQKVVKPEPEIKVPAAVEAAAQDVSHEGVIGSKIAKEATYQLPPPDLLKKPVIGPISNDNLQENSKILESALAQFGIEVKVVEIEQGPVITRYELLPAPGVKVNSITALSDDLALALKAKSIRIIAPIPGKAAVGVEVPNSVSNIVYLRALIESPAKKQRLALTLGQDTSGKSLIPDLTTMPHLLIAGTTGSGKTVCMNSIIIGLLYQCTPEELKFVMIDPKMVELAAYNKIPHMLTPVVTDVRKAYKTLNWVVQEMENRYKLFATVGVRNIQSFNERPMSEEAIEEVESADPESKNVIPAQLPYIVLVIDELADLMMVAQDKVEGAITRLAQLARATGIHLIIATQRPSVDVITGVIKANFPARISFKVASKVDSRTVLDANGGDQLLGRGDMLFMQPGDSKPTRGQACLVEDAEINRVVKFVSEQAKPEFHPEILKAQEGKSKNGASEKDELFSDAVKVVMETRQASTSNLQRRMRLGYTRAARIIDQMEAEGLIGPTQGARPREIYMSQDMTEAEPV